MRMRMILALLSTTLVICCTPKPSVPSLTSSGKVGVTDVYRYQVGNITYLLFEGNAGSVDVVNYTQDSIDYEYNRYEPTPGITDSIALDSIRNVYQLQFDTSGKLSYMDREGKFHHVPNTK